MITRPVAVARALLVAGAVWGLGALLTGIAFDLMGASTTISDVAGETQRVQIVWWGAHAFFACAGAVLGVAMGGTALTRAEIDEPPTAVLVAGVPVLLLLGVLLFVVHTWGAMSQPMTVASAIGLGIGVVCGAFYVLESGPPDDALDDFYSGRARKAGRTWGSR